MKVLKNSESHGFSSNPMDNEEISFGRFRLHLGRRELRRDEALVQLHRPALDLLCTLAAAKGQVVSKGELMAELWPGRIVEEGNLYVHVSGLRKALDEHGEGHNYIITVPGRGYRLAGLPGRTSERLIEPSALSLPDKPSIAVLPFANLSGDPEQEYFADGMVEEIITALSRIRWLFVIARNSSFTYKNRAVDVKQVARELGVRYILEGSVRKDGNRVRITAQLIAAETGAHLWADRFDGSKEGVFDLQDQVATSVAGVIEPTLQAAETSRSSRRPTKDLTAYDLYLRGYEAFLASAERTTDALRLMEQAIERDPGYGPALAWAALCCFHLIMDGRSGDPTLDRQKGANYARRALEVAAGDAATIANAAFSLDYFGEDRDAMMNVVDRALALNPSFARGWHIGGVMRLRSGEPDEAIKYLERSLRLRPRERVGASRNAIGAAHFFARRFDEAAARLLLAIQDDPSFPQPYRYLAACYAQMGRLDDAREIVARLRGITPIVIPDVSYLRNPEHRELFLSGLRLAMGESEQPPP